MENIIPKSSNANMFDIRQIKVVRRYANGGIDYHINGALRYCRYNTGDRLWWNEKGELTKISTHDGWIMDRRWSQTSYPAKIVETTPKPDAKFQFIKHKQDYLHITLIILLVGWLIFRCFSDSF